MTPMVCQVAVRFADSDVFGHVNHTRHLTFCEEHRNHFFERWTAECGSDPLDGGLVIARVECDYLAPLPRRTRSVTVAMVIESVGRTSLVLRYEISAAGVSLAAVVRTVVVLVDERGAARPLSDVERRFAGRYLFAELESA